MLQNLVSLNLTAADMTALNGALDTIRTTLGDRAVSLTPQQRQELTKMGDKSRIFCEQAVAGIRSHAGSMPADLDVAGLTLDLEDFDKLSAFYTDYQAVGEKIDDTLKASSSDVMTGSIVGVTFLKALNKLNPALDTLLASLRNVRRSKPKAKPPVA